MQRIGVISDTHGLLRPEAISKLEGVCQIVHAGDIGKPEIVSCLAGIAPVTTIRGNVDTADWAQAFPETACLDVAGRRIFVIHDRNDLAFDPAEEGYDLVISGHCHRPGFETVENVLYLNPGSAGPRRFKLPVTLATLDLEQSPLVPAIHQLV
ncbi:hypothetical protein FP2506_17989 [Fulvimarina pelagi HTCC2506]|uniref:Phosphoesterase n=1 Tax=Fulvimarina pelagi HTCC2506 TaxID=314231 RepID=Q0G135_9HYPH|nr:metallophosphoesterase family protein [Fulvimarina pelagi]EAU40804.1 hypothetical protein FP2506_17989 [Fulvimarina pelagi HTCC2506]